VGRENIIGEAVHPPVSIHVAVVAVPLAAHRAPYTPPVRQLRIGSTVQSLLCRGQIGTDVEGVQALHVVDERRHVAQVRVTQATRGGQGFGVRRAHVPVVLGPVIGQVAAQFARQRWPVIRARDLVVSVLTAAAAAVKVVSTVICAHGRSEKMPAAAGHLTRQARVRAMLVARVPPQFRLASGAICVARFTHFA